MPFCASPSGREPTHVAVRNKGDHVLVARAVTGGLEVEIYVHQLGEGLRGISFAELARSNARLIRRGDMWDQVK